MAKKKRRAKYKKYRKYIMPAVALGAGAAGMSLIGSKLAGAGVGSTGLVAGGSAMAGFVGPAAAIGGAGMTMEMMRELNYRKKRRR